MNNKKRDRNGLCALPAMKFMRQRADRAAEGFKRAVNHKALAFCIIVAAQVMAQSPVELLRVSTVGNDCHRRVNGVTFQNDAILSHNGWQYTAYYNTASPRHIVMARRKLPDGAWQKFTFTDYEQTRDDGHNIISIGKSPEDGTLHLSWDQHARVLKYRRSVAGLLNNPESKSWNASQFLKITNSLDGQRQAQVTYPIFITAPNGKLYFSRRFGTHGNGHQILYEYSKGSWTTIGKYTEGRGADGSTANAYVDDIVFSDDGRMHISWIWRTGPLHTAHDICYAYSDDYGRTWYSSDGKKVGTTNEDAMSRARNPELTVVPIERGLLINQEGMTVDSKGRPHIVHSLGDQLHHFYRDTAGTWHTIDCGIKSGQSPRRQIVSDAQNNVYIMFASLKIAMATEAGGYKDWKVVNTELDGQYSSAPLFDQFYFKDSNILSMFLIKKNSTTLQVADFKINTGSPPPQPPPPPPRPEGFYSTSDFTAIQDLGTGNTGGVKLSLDVTPVNNSLDGVIGVADNSVNVTGYSDLAMLVRLNPSGSFDARNGSSFNSDVSIPYVAGQTYKLEIVANMDANTYDVFVNSTQIASGYSFRSNAPATDNAGVLCLRSREDSTFYVNNVVVSPVSVSFGNAIMPKANVSTITASQGRYITIQTEKRIRQVTIFDVAGRALVNQKQSVRDYSTGKTIVSLAQRQTGPVFVRVEFADGDESLHQLLMVNK